MYYAYSVLLVPLVVSIAGLVVGAATGVRLLAALAAGLATVFLALGAGIANVHLANEGRQQPREAARVNATFLAIGWGWAGLAMLAVYLRSGLKWQHGWQYGSGMLLIAGLIAAYAYALSEPQSRFATDGWLRAAQWANDLQALAAAMALAWLLLSGKLETAKGDWAANDIFVAGGAAIVALAVIARFAAARSRRSTADH